MILRNVIGTASAILLLTAAGCDSDSNGDDDDTHEDGGVDAGGDAGTSPDSGTDLDSGKPDATIDAAADAKVNDAASDAATDAAASDAQVATDAASMDAAQGDASSDAATGDAGPALSAHYKFDETSGTSAANSSGTLGAATLIDGPTWTTGKRGGAVDLAGGPAGDTGPHISLPVNIVDGCADVTIAMWMKLGSAPFWSRLLEIDGLINGFLYFTATREVSGEPQLAFTIFHDDQDPETPNDHLVSAAYPEGTTLVDQWHHVAFTLSNGTGRLYFDGAEIGSNAMLWTPATLMYDAAGHAWMGRSMFPDPYLDASLDDLRIACSAYSAAEIAALAQ